MTEQTLTRRKAATAVFKLANKTMETGMHRTVDREPKGKGWVDCAIGLDGMMCKPEKVNEAIQLFEIAYEIFPDIVALNQVALAYEILGDKPKAAGYFMRMKEQAKQQENGAYVQAAEAGLARVSR